MTTLLVLGARGEPRPPRPAATPRPLAMLCARARGANRVACSHRRVSPGGDRFFVFYELKD
jgi:hypothetical protein